MKAAELCAGYGGLALAVEHVFGAETAWVSEFEDAPSRILAHHWPNVPNHGDMTKIDWAAVEPVDIISGGTPCQDLSAAGKRAGMTEGTRSNLWVQMREAIATTQPTYVVWENVRGAYSASAYSEMEQSEGRMGEDGNPNLRAIGRVLGDLSDLGYDCQWRGLRAADVGAPHGRYRVFVLATHPGRVGRHQAIEHHGSSQAGSDRASVPHQSDSHHLRPRPIREVTADRHDLRGDGRGKWPKQDGRGQLENGGHAVADTDDGVYIEGQGNLVAATPSGEWATQADYFGPTNSDRGSTTNWGAYEPAIRRWEQTLGRRAPAPTEPGRNGRHRLSPRFTEWMMGMPDGWIVDVPGVSRNEQLKAAGNGVVPQQAIAALQDMLRTT